MVTISTTTPGASIRYTTDGSTPSSTAGIVYSGPVSVSSNLTLKAVAYGSGLTDSAVGSAAYTITIQAATPTFNPPAGSYSSTQSVTISTTTAGASIRYTTDGIHSFFHHRDRVQRTGLREQQPDAQSHRIRVRADRQRSGFRGLHHHQRRLADRPGTTPPGPIARPLPWTTPKYRVRGI